MVYLQKTGLPANLIGVGQAGISRGVTPVSD
jgi:hypothetical protein